MICKNPIVLGFVAGILLFLLPLSMPELVSSLISGTALMNGPLAMIIMGAYLGQIKIGEIFLNRQIYLCCAASSRHGTREGRFLGPDTGEG